MHFTRLPSVIPADSRMEAAAFSLRKVKVMSPSYYDIAVSVRQRSQCFNSLVVVYFHSLLNSFFIFSFRFHICSPCSSALTTPFTVLSFPFFLLHSFFAKFTCFLTLLPSFLPLSILLCNFSSSVLCFTFYPSFFMQSFLSHLFSPKLMYSVVLHFPLFTFHIIPGSFFLIHTAIFDSSCCPLGFFRL